MALEWKLRKIMAEKGIWSGAELIRLMNEKAGYSLSAPSVSALLTGQPKQMKAETLDALCTALECTPGDLWAHTPTKVMSNTNISKHTKLAEAVNSHSNKLPPI